MFVSSEQKSTTTSQRLPNVGVHGLCSSLNMTADQFKRFVPATPSWSAMPALGGFSSSFAFAAPSLPQEYWTPAPTEQPLAFSSPMAMPSAASSSAPMPMVSAPANCESPAVATDASYSAFYSSPAQSTISLHMMDAAHSAPGSPIEAPHCDSTSDDLLMTAPPSSPNDDSLKPPPYDYKGLIRLALQSEQAKNGMSVADIYDWIEESFPYYGTPAAPCKWKSRIRNVLTINNAFKRIPHPKGGRTGKWTLRENAPKVSANPMRERATSHPANLTVVSGVKSAHSIDHHHHATKADQCAHTAKRLSSSPSISRSVSAHSLSALEHMDSFGPATPVSDDVATSPAMGSVFSTTPVSPLPSSSYTDALVDYYTMLAFSVPTSTLFSQGAYGAAATSATDIAMINELAHQLKLDCTQLQQQQQTLSTPNMLGYTIPAPIALS